MGGCGGKGTSNSFKYGTSNILDANRADPTTTAINEEIKKDQENQDPIKILLLGAGESGIERRNLNYTSLTYQGKSTFAKQIKIIHCGGFTEPEMYLFKEVIGIEYEPFEVSFLTNSYSGQCCDSFFFSYRSD